MPRNLPAHVESRATNGVQLECAFAGKTGQPLVILLHGFPDVWQGWHQQLEPLTAAGFRVIAPNQRGYGKSDKPPGIAAYDLDRLAGDVVGLADSEGVCQFSVVGHDWGGIVAWWVAARFPERVNRLAILNAPHPGIFFDYLLRSPMQRLRSWYIAFFQIPWLPEWLLAARNYELLFRSVMATSRPGTFDDNDRALLTAAWSEAGALTSMLNYYRAIARRSSRSLRRRVTPRTLILMSDLDPTEEAGLATASLKLCDQARIEWLRGAKHWIQREEAALVTAALLEFLGS